MEDNEYKTFKSWLDDKESDINECFRCPKCIRIFNCKKRLFKHLMSSTKGDIFARGHGLNNKNSKKTLVKYKFMIKPLDNSDMELEKERLQREIDRLSYIQLNYKGCENKNDTVTYSESHKTKNNNIVIPSNNDKEIDICTSNKEYQKSKVNVTEEMDICTSNKEYQKSKVDASEEVDNCAINNYFQKSKNASSEEMAICSKNKENPKSKINVLVDRK